jgi:hypothetical protein
LTFSPKTLIFVNIISPNTHTMTKPYFRSALIALVILLFTPPMQAQHYIRRMWQADFGAPALTDWSVSQWAGEIIFLNTRWNIFRAAKNIPARIQKKNVPPPKAEEEFLNKICLFQ